jgi:hypothetical protein
MEYKEMEQPRFRSSGLFLFAREEWGYANVKSEGTKLYQSGVT